ENDFIIPRDSQFQRGDLVFLTNAIHFPAVNLTVVISIPRVFTGCVAEDVAVQDWHTRLTGHCEEGHPFNDDVVIEDNDPLKKRKNLERELEAFLGPEGIWKKPIEDTSLCKKSKMFIYELDTTGLYTSTGSTHSGFLQLLLWHILNILRHLGIVYTGDTPVESNPHSHTTEAVVNEEVLENVLQEEEIELAEEVKEPETPMVNTGSSDLPIANTVRPDLFLTIANEMPTTSHTNIWVAGLPPSLPTITKEIFKYLNKPDDAIKNTNEFRNNTPGTSKDFPKRKVAVSNWNWDMGDGPKHHPMQDIPEIRNGFSLIFVTSYGPNSALGIHDADSYY
ncbi:unnamed protein product, partial [Allacma fusca]